MDPAIWSNIPDGVIEHIVSFLPVPVRVRFSTVCKLWNTSIITSNSGESPALVFQFFKAAKGRKRLQMPWLAVYDIPDKRWYSIAFDFIPPHPQMGHLYYAIVSASGGLLCLRPNKEYGVGFIVCNPVTRNWAELPCSGNEMTDLVVMHVDHGNRYYKVLAVSTSLGDVTYELYDSRSCKWTLTEKNPSSRGNIKPHIVCLCGSNAYLLYKNMNGERYPCQEVDVYDMEQEKWKPSLPAPPESFKALNLLDSNGRLLIIGRVCNDPAKDEILIWEFTASVDGLDSSWREVERMPEDATVFLGISVFDCSWVSRGDQLFLIGGRRNTIVVYDVLKRTWSNLPNSTGKKPWIRFNTGFAFDLCLQRF